jgi:hypothetical protein
LSLGDDAVKPDLPLLHQEVNANYITFGSAPGGFDEETAGAEVADVRNFADTAALPVDPHIPCSRETRRSSPGGDRANR